MKLRRKQLELGRLPRSAVVATEAAPERQWDFRPERDIPDQFWDKIIEEMDKKIERNDVWHFLNTAQALCVMRPRIREAIGKNEVLFQNCLEAMKRERDKKGISFAGIAAKMCTIFPDSMSEIDFSDDDFNTISVYIEQESRKGIAYRVAELVSLKTVFPERWKEHPLGKGLYEDFINIFEERSHVTLATLSLVRDMVLLFPEKKSEILEKCPFFQQELAELQEQDLDDNIALYRSAVFSLTVLSAEEVSLSRQGIELEMGGGVLTAGQSLPVRKKV